MNVVVTGGGTDARPIDDVRQIANVSSGRFSAVAITEACTPEALGARQVWHIHTCHRPQLPLLIRSTGFDLTLRDRPRPRKHANRLDDLAQAAASGSTVADRLHLVPLPPGDRGGLRREPRERVLRSHQPDRRSPSSRWRSPDFGFEPVSRQARFRRRDDGGPRPTRDAEGDPLGARLVVGRLPRRLQAPLACKRNWSARPRPPAGPTAPT